MAAFTPRTKHALYQENSSPKAQKVSIDEEMFWHYLRMEKSL